MSLDISATLLISANAPIWALIQRLGRLNRWVEKSKQGYMLKTNRICKALIYPWEKEKPYEKEDMETGKNLVKSLEGQIVNQTQLAEEMSKISLQAPSPDKCEWLQTWQARQGELMKAGYTIQVILANDVAKITSSTEKPYLEAQKWAVSVPIQDTTKNWDKKTFKFYRIAPTVDVHYHPKIGAYDPKLNKSLQTRYGHKT